MNYQTKTYEIGMRRCLNPAGFFKETEVEFDAFRSFHRMSEDNSFGRKIG